ncbi:MAG: amino acid ABC transporter permease [Paracoccaceae bacterium]
MARKRPISNGVAVTPTLGSRPALTVALDWLKKNLFDGLANSLVSLSLIVLIAILLSELMDWAVFNGIWSAGTYAECNEIRTARHGEDAYGACWGVLKENVGRIVFGFYPPQLYWRPITALILLAAALAPILMRSVPRVFLSLSAIYPVLAYLLIWGGLGLETVQSRALGGLLFTVILTGLGTVLAIPLGIALALGRQFSIRPLRILCAMLIAFVRGVPLIVLLFAVFLLANIVLPAGTYFDPILRAALVIALHTGARMAGAIHEALVAIPPGQWEAASALGFGYRKIISIVVLPQVLRSLSPWLVLASVGVFRDTTLVAVAGFFDPVALVSVFRAQADWQGVNWEIFILVGLIYWCICFCMTCYSKHLAKKRKAERGCVVNLNPDAKTRPFPTDSLA